MKIQFESKPLDQIKHRCLIILANREGQLLNGPADFAEVLKPFVETGEFGKSFGGSFYLANPDRGQAERLLFFNIGENVKGPDDIRRAVARAWKILRAKNYEEALLSLEGLGDDLQKRAAVEGFVLGDYQFTQLKSEKDKLPTSLKALTLHCVESDQAKVQTWNAIALGTCRARDLSQLPANILDPSKFAELAQEWSEAGGYKVTVLDEDHIRDAGMGAMYSVGQGSAKESKFMVLEYEPANPSGKTVALVGKAVTFDSGGLSLKPGKGMEEMKGDMGGGAAVLGVMSVLKQTQCPHRVIGLIPSVENMPSASATRPSDVVTSLSGLTIEVNNTDAEGRLILADALTYADRFKPDYVIDYATLTGACMVALGPKVCAVLGNHQPLVDAVLKAGEEVSEPFWQLPLVEEYNQYLKSQTADISNIASIRWGGTIIAGLFLQRFADKYKWAHCDIAAGIFEKGDDYTLTGGTGVGVRMTMRMFELLD